VHVGEEAVQSNNNPSLERFTNLKRKKSWGVGRRSGISCATHAHQFRNYPSIVRHVAI
jgi:hypothetical protein